MNRIEFMIQLAALLQDIPVVERQDAMKYYNDYFDDAGEENEQAVIAELESPEKVAATIKADLGITAGEDAEDDKGEHYEYRENGYADTRFERKDIPADRAYRQAAGQEPPRKSPVLKVLLILAIILVGAPVIVPAAIAIIAVVFSCIVAAAALFFSALALFAALAVMGIILTGAGLVALIPETAAGFALIGTGLLMGIIGVIGSVGSVKLCVIVLPAIFRGIVWLCRKPFERKAVA